MSLTVAEVNRRFDMMHSNLTKLKGKLYTPAPLPQFDALPLGMEQSLRSLAQTTTRFSADRPEIYAMIDSWKAMGHDWQVEAYIPVSRPAAEYSTF